MSECMKTSGPKLALGYFLAKADFTSATVAVVNVFPGMSREMGRS